MNFTIKKLAELTGSTIINCNNPEEVITGLNTIEEAGNSEISFLHNEKYFDKIETTKALCVIAPESLKSDRNIPILVNSNPYAAFQKLVLAFFPQQRIVKEGISKLAEVCKTVSYGEGLGVGSFTFIGEDVVIGKNVQIAQNVTIYNGVRIGDNSIIHAGVTIRENCVLGNGVILQNGSVIGSDGFGFSPTNGKYEKIPQVGNVILEDLVEIGANVTIDRATLGSTIIRKGTKLDNLIQIGHNAEIGNDTVIAAQTGVSGSTKIGSNCMIGGQVGFAGHLKIGDQCGIGAQAGVGGNLKAGSVVTGTPAKEFKKQRKIDASLSRLPDMVYKLKDLEKEIKKLSENRSN